MLLLGVVTDYAVFFLHGMKQRLEAGETRLDAAHAATSEYLPIVVTAGLIVAGGTAALVVGELAFFRAFGPGMALTVLVSLAIAITLIPALMAILGARLYWPRRPRRPGTEPPQPRRVPRPAGARRRSARALAVAGLAVACRGLLDTNLGITQIQGLPEDAQQRRAQDAAATGFAAGILSPTVLLLEDVDPERGCPRSSASRVRSPVSRGSRPRSGPRARRAAGSPVSSSPPTRRGPHPAPARPRASGRPGHDIVERLRERLPT